MVWQSGAARFYSGRDFHRRRGARGVCRGPQYVPLRPLGGVTTSLRAMSGVHLRLVYVESKDAEDRRQGRSTLHRLFITHRNGTVTGGLIGSIILLLQNMLGFSYSLRGLSRTGNRSVWDRLVDELHAGQADMMAGTLIYSPARGRLVDFSYPFATDLSGVVIGVRHTQTLSEFRATQPLQGRAWYALLAVLAAAVLVLCLIARCRVRLRETRWAREAESSPEEDASFWALIVLGICCQQGAVVRADGALSYRLAVSAVYLLSFFIFACYSGTLLAQMAITRRQMPFASLDEAFARGWKLNVEGVSLAAREMIVQPLLAGQDLRHLPTTRDRSLQGKNLRPYTSGRVGHYFNCSERGQASECPACIWPGMVFRHPVSLVFRPNFPYLRLINYVMPQLLDRGIMSRELRKWRPIHPAERLCPTDTVSVEKTRLDLETLQHLFTIAGAGMLCSVAVLLLESVASQIWLFYSTRLG
ncbi:glutamate receptor 2-like [Pollicipes pollicipes]|uniref:glutamate receptor 2-like n=1 Tax=Pollicipes pollicipes TaxID=41117 RepID=UPI001884CA99|nr:glutamate receptor 2-like [Pollicipes pollicipes]